MFARTSRARWVEKVVKRRDPSRVHDGKVQSGNLARVVRRAERPGEPSAVLQGVDAADLRKDVVRELRLESANRIFQPAMPEVAAAWIREDTVANIAAIAVVRVARSRSPKTPSRLRTSRFSMLSDMRCSRLPALRPAPGRHRRTARRR